MKRRLHPWFGLAIALALVAAGLALAVTGGVARAATSGAWRGTGAMAIERRDHTATLLQEGRVLVAGGADATATGLASAELYDPSTGTWTPTGSMAAARSFHTATLLPDGQVLVVGGPTAERYDPGSGTWASAGDLPVIGRSQHTATLLDDGRVLVAGTYDGGGPWSKTTALYNPATGSWTPAASMGTGRWQHVAIRLASGKVLVTGGQGAGGGSLASAEIYDPLMNTWTATAGLNTGRHEARITGLASGKVLVTGGLSCQPYNGGCAAPSSAELYDPATAAWSAAGNMDKVRTGHSAIRLVDGTVLIAGGYYWGTSWSQAERYDPGTDQWSLTGSMLKGRSFHTTTLLKNGTVLVAGGIGVGLDMHSAELYDPAPPPPTPAVSASPGTLIFGPQPVGTPGKPQSVTVTNSGGGPLLIAGITASGDFAPTSTCPIAPAPLVARASCTIDVTFAPTVAGGRSGTLTIASNATGGATTVALGGTGAVPLVGLDRTGLTFADQQVGTASVVQTVTLRNIGDADLAIAGITVSGDFARTHTCPTTLVPQASCTIGVTFAPTVAGARTGALTIADSAAGTPHTIPLDGVGVAPPTYTLILSATTGGVATAAPGPGPYAAGATVTVTATPSDGYRFAGWLVDGRASATTTTTLALTMTAAHTIVANFAPLTSQEQLSLLRSTLAGFQLKNKAVASVLDSTLQRVQVALDAGKFAQAANQLDTFIAQVRAQDKNVLSQSQADALVRAAQLLKATLPK